MVEPYHVIENYNLNFNSNILVLVMPRLNLNIRKCVIVLKRGRYSLTHIWKWIQEEEGCNYSLKSVYRLWRKFRDCHAIIDLPRKKCE